MSKRQVTVLSFAIALLFASALPLLVLRAPRPALEIRAQPRQLPAGKVFAGHPFGQSFLYPGPELDRIDVLFVRQPGESSRKLTLTLRKDNQAGEVLRTVEIAPPAQSAEPQFLAFKFAPIEDAADRVFHFEITCTDGVSDWSPWISWRGRSGAALPWGDHTVPNSDAHIEVKCLRNNLSAVALAVDGLNVPAGACHLEVREVGEGAIVRRGFLGHESPIAGGYALFAFEPIEDSRWKDYEFQFVLPDDARVVATERGISTISLHGSHQTDEPVNGMTHGSSALPYRDLIFRAAGETRARDQLALLFTRLGWPRLFAAWLLSWISSGWALALLLSRMSREPS